MDYINKDYFGFNAQSGGYFPFQGVMSNGKPIKDIKVNSNSATITYVDDELADENKVKYFVSADVVKKGENTEIKNISENWGSNLWSNNYSADNIGMESLLAMIAHNAKPISLEYKENSYTVPTGITPATGETFDSIIETWGTDEETLQPITSIYGIGVLNRGQATETFTRLIFPDASFITLIGW